jgi:hypothetical protein
MICGLEALVKMEEERIKREEEKRRQKEEEERQKREYIEERKIRTIPFCDNELTKHIERKIKNNEKIEMAIRYNENYNNELVDICVYIRHCYADGESAYSRIGYDIHYETFVKYVTSHCWTIIGEAKERKHIYGLGRYNYHSLISFELTPSPGCLTIV